MGDYITIVSDNGGGNVAYCATLNQEEDIFYARVTPAEVTSSLPLFTVRSVKRDASGATITFRGEIGKTYRCDFGAKPAAPWSPLQSNIAGTGADITLSDPDAAGKPARFYRIVVLP